jgi:hypothetical protein|tara:strand:- start:316 stop:483 length:168 start_codon:yes stop_codon:yes gene_type:complete
MIKSVEDNVIEYVKNNYKTGYGKSDILIVEEVGNTFRISDHKDGSPLILSKNILK